MAGNLISPSFYIKIFKYKLTKNFEKTLQESKDARIKKDELIANSRARKGVNKYKRLIQ